MNRAVCLGLLMFSASCTASLSARLAPDSARQLVQAPLTPDRDWLSPLERGHPLEGKIWEVGQGRFVDDSALSAACASADLLVLGETHDNPDHHLLQARLLRATARSGRKPALAFEMITPDRQRELEEQLARAPQDVDALGQALRWSESGWPDFRMYRPIFEVGLDAGLPIRAANLTRAEMRAIIGQGEASLDQPSRTLLERAGPPDSAALEGLRDEMRASHCHQLPEEMIDPMVLGQRARDARIAESVLEASRGRGAVLITGSGHARTDRGVPYYLRPDLAGRKLVSVAFVEVDESRPQPQSYAEEWGSAGLPFDFVVFTPRMEREDPCQALKERASKK